MSRPAQMHGPGPVSNLCVWPALPLVGCLGKQIRRKLSERQRRAAGESWGPRAVHHSWRPVGGGSWHCSDWGSQSLPGPRRGERFSGGICTWCPGSPGLLQTQTPHRRAAVSPALYWFSAHLPRWCWGARGCQALCTQHRDWGWSPVAVSPGTQKTEGRGVYEEAATPHREEAGTTGEFNPHMVPQTLDWWYFFIIDESIYKIQVKPGLTMPDVPPKLNSLFVYPSADPSTY